MDNGLIPYFQDSILNIQFRSKKRIVKPLLLEEQMNNIKQNESLAAILLFKRGLELEIAELEEMEKANVQKKLQTKHIRDEILSSQLERESIIKEGFDKNTDMSWKLVLKGLGSFEDEEDFRRAYKTFYNDSIKKLQRENILKEKRILLAKWNNLEILKEENSVNKESFLEENDSMEIEKETKKTESSPSSPYYSRVLSEGWVYF